MPGNSHEYPDYPFCSKRCRIIDLGHWLGEDYRVPGKNAAEPASTDGSDEG